MLLVAGLLFATAIQAESPGIAEMRAAAEQHRAASFELFREFLELPNDANHPADIDALILWMEDAFASRGFTTRRLATGSSPALFAERLRRDDAPTVLVYLQADGQPVDPAAWDQDDPWLPALKSRDAAGRWQQLPWSLLLSGNPDPDWRIFARSASDSKGPMTQFMIAVELLDRLGFEPNYNLKVIIDTEEELGSPNLAAAVRDNRELLAADLLLIFDGPPHASNEPTVAFGARGIATVTITTYGPRVAQHSGHYGNFLPNPVFDMARILASLKTPDGRVAIEGYYDGVRLSDAERAILAAVPDDEAAILDKAGVAIADAVAPSLQEALAYPSLNVRGLRAAWIGAQARTIIPPTATAEIDIRLVKESDPAHLIGLLRDHIESQGYYVIDREPNDAERRQQPKILTFTSAVSYPAFRSDFEAEAGRMARAGLRRLYGQEPILIRSMGGSIPIAPLVETLGVPAAIVPSVNIDNNQHSPNENIRVGNFLEGIVMLMAVLGQDAPASN